MPDDELAAMMQNVVIGGGFISNAIHSNWMKGADEEEPSSSSSQKVSGQTIEGEVKDKTQTKL